ncbi:hypothetical protein [Mycobacterium sp. 94-17]|uniref:hypothetical protein n=1 Tax=Mycobacterium sp. 94-17 TaxID=2986147 RepID=UPI002D1F7C83|nr:hypothetical protein [Mycobacterium sp. 94-17]MEB4208772.1 hypothetical protein [Mycobacterium sp. 94-17]
MDNIPIHVDYAADHEAMRFNANQEPILSYRSWSTTGARVADHKSNRDRQVIDGWVLNTPDGDEWITGCWELDGVDNAVEKARGYLRDVYGLPDARAYYTWVTQL